MNANTSLPVYALTILEPSRGFEMSDNGDSYFEAGSSIKSAIGTLALEKAASTDVDIGTYAMTLQSHHYSNGSGFLKESPVFRPAESGDDASHLVPLREVITFSTLESDCVATNVLIDYVGGQDSVNKGLRSQLGLETTKLLTERLHFPGVDHEAQPFQVGITTTNDMAAYYQRLWSPESRLQLMSGEHTWHRTQHRSSYARLFGLDQLALPESIDWYHKTGSIIDRDRDVFYESVVDAGMLRAEGRELFIAGAALLLRHTPSGDDMYEVEEGFAVRNETALSELDIALPDEEAAA